MNELKDPELPLTLKPVDEVLTDLLVEFLGLGQEFKFFDLSSYAQSTKGIKADYDKRETELVEVYRDLFEQHKDQWVRQAQGETVSYLLNERPELLAEDVSLKEVLFALREFHKNKAAVKLPVHIPVTYNDQPEIVAVRVK